MLKRPAQDHESGRAIKRQDKGKDSNIREKQSKPVWNEDFVKGKAAFAEGKYEIALERFSQAIKLDTSHNTMLLDCRAATYEKLGNFSAALLDAKDIVKHAPKQSRGYLRAGKIFTMQKQNQRARKLYERALQHVDPSDPRYSLLVQLEKTLPKQVKPGCRDFVQFLPYDILTLIFGQISSFPRLIQCMHVSRSWRHFLQSWPGMWRDLDFATVKTSSTMLKHFMSMVPGKHVQKFSYANGNGINALKLLVDRDCHYLRALELSNCTISKSVFVRTLRLMGRQLTHLTLNFNRFESDYDVHEIFQTCPKLTHFIWEGAEKFLSQTNLDIDLNITHLKISLSTGGNVPERYLLPLLKQCRKLKSLVLEDMYQSIDRMSFARIMEACPGLVSYRTDGIVDDWDKYNEYPSGLRQIMIPDGASSNHIESLFQTIERSIPTLQMLDVRGIDAAAKRVLQRLSIVNAADLRVLMMAWATDVNEQDLVDAVDSMPNLELIRLKSMPGVKNTILEKLGQLGSLRYVDISSCSGVTGAGLQALVDNAPSLEGLKLVDCINIRADAIEYLRNKLGRRAVECRLSTM